MVVPVVVLTIHAAFAGVRPACDTSDVEAALEAVTLVTDVEPTDVEFLLTVPGIRLLVVEYLEHVRSRARRARILSRIGATIRAVSKEAAVPEEGLVLAQAYDEFMNACYPRVDSSEVPQRQFRGRL